MSILEEVREDARQFSHWSTVGSYSPDRFEEELIDYVNYMETEGKMIPPTVVEWDFDDQLIVTLTPSDDPNNQYCVTFHLRVPLNGVSDSAMDAYDRAMRGI